MRTKRSQKIEEGIVISFGVLILGGLGALLVYSFRHTDVTEKGGLDKPVRLVVVSPHQDDEMVIAGHRMIRNQNLGGENFVIYVTDGAPFRYRTFDSAYARQRRLEALAALKTIGVPKDHVFFLRYSDRPRDFTRGQTRGAVQRIAALIRTLKPDEIFTSAYEGGHCMHDLTNYITFKAIKAAEWNGRFYESAEYNPFMNLTTPWKVIKTLSKGGFLSGIPKGWIIVIPKFIPEYAANNLTQTPIYEFPATKKEIKLKLKAMIKYRTQNLGGDLVKKLAFNDKFRPYPGHDYCQAPFKFSTSWNFMLERVWSRMKRSKRDLTDPRYSACQIRYSEFAAKLLEEEKCDVSR